MVNAHVRLDRRRHLQRDLCAIADQSAEHAAGVAAVARARWSVETGWNCREIVAHDTRFLEVHPDVLDLEVLLDALGATFAAKPALLDAAEWRRRVADHAAVEADHAGLERLDRAEGA